MIFGIAGAALTALDRTHRTLRIFAITLLTYIGTRLTFAALIIIFDFWRGPAPLYFEFFVIPLYAIFAAQFFGRVLGNLSRMRGWISPNRSAIEIQLVVGGIVAVLALAATTSRPDYGFPFPPASTQITDILAQETGLQPGMKFRGRTADMIGRSLDRNVGWLDLHSVDASLGRATGNELRLVGLHYFGIPGLFQYTPTISPSWYAVSSRLLALRGDRQMRNVVVLRDFKPRILAMLGVRFVVTDRAYNGPARLRATVPTGDQTLFLYEIANPNVGNYSPTTVSKIVTASDIIAAMNDPSFDPTSEVIGDLPSDAYRLVPAHGARLTFLGASLRLQAESAGHSILLLPLEFSRCLEATVAGSEKPLLFRANLVETAVLFSGQLDATLSVRTGPFLHPACRVWDLLDARRLRVGDVPPRVAPPPGG